MQGDNPKTTYLNTAGCGLISAASLKAGADIYNEFAVNSSARSEVWREKEDPLYRERLAGFLEVDQDRLGYIPNFSYAMNMVVQSLRGDERILVYKNDYPSIYAPFVQNGFTVHFLESEDGFSLNIHTIEDQITEHKIDIVAIGHVQWQTGFKIDLPALTALCKKHHVKLIVDATQSLGAIPIPMQKLGIDVVISSHYKWMNSGFGNGLIYFDPSFLEAYPPVIIGAATLDFAGKARSYEPGGLNIYGLALLDQAIRDKQQIGAQNIHIENMRLTKTLLDGLAPHKDQIEILGDYSIDQRASIVVIKDTGNHNGQLGAFLENAGIIVTGRGGTLRVSIHFYNTAEQIGYFLEVLNNWLK